MSKNPARPIHISYNGSEYILNFNRKTIRRMEENGFDITKIRSMPISGVLTLFHGAFLMYHRNIRPEETEEIWDSMTNKTKLLSALINLYTDNINALMDDEAEEDDENPTWSFQ